MLRPTNLSLVFAISLTLLLNGINWTPALAQETHCGTLTSSETWAGKGTIHHVTCGVTVPQNISLTIAAGAIVKFSRNTSLVIHGTLKAQGEFDQVIYFTSDLDDSAGNTDTNKDGPSVGSPGNWITIMFVPLSESWNFSDSIIDHAIIRYGGRDENSGGLFGAIELHKASLTIQNTTITQNALAGIKVLSSNPVLGCNEIYSNHVGIENWTPDKVLHAENQWWGSASGPYAPNNSVSSGVSFRPWRQSPCNVTIYLPVIIKPQTP